MALRILVTAIMVASFGCGKDESSGGETASANARKGSATADDQSGEQPAGTSQGRKKRVKKDRGDGSMMLGELEWLATSARARRKKDVLSISMSRMDGSVGDKMVRHSLDLHIRDFKGPGDYTIAMNRGVPSLYIVVGIEIPKNESDEATKAAAIQALNESKSVPLGGAKVTIASVTDTEIVGTFEHKGAKVPMTNGKFRAIIKPQS